MSESEFVRSMTIFAEANVDVDLRMLRSFRVLRPLKLVSRIPSKGTTASPCIDINIIFEVPACSRAEFSLRLNEIVFRAISRLYTITFCVLS